MFGRSTFNIKKNYFECNLLRKNKNKFIKKLNIINPVTAFQNHINALASTDYYAYLHFRNHIQSIIDKKIRLILEDTWNKVLVSKDTYIEYVNKFQ